MNYDENPIYTRNDEAKIHKHTFIISTEETRQCKQIKQKIWKPITKKII